MISGIEDIAQTCLICGKHCSNRRSLGNHLARSHKDIDGLEEYTLLHFLNFVVPKCKCGCGKNVIWHKTKYKFNDYVTGHNPAGFRVTQPTFSKTQIEKRNKAIRESYRKNKEHFSKKISEKVSIALKNSEFDFSDHMLELWKKEEFVENQRMSRIKSWQGEAGEIRKEKVFTPEFGKKISIANMNRDSKKGSKIENNFVNHLKTFIDENDIEISKWFNFSEKIWCADVYIPSINLIIEFDGAYWHGLDRDEDYTKNQLSSIINDFRKNKLAKDKKLNLIRISDDSNWQSTKSLEDLRDVAYHVVENGTVIKEGTKRFGDKTKIIKRSTLLKFHLEDPNNKEYTQKELLPTLKDVIREHSNYWGWFYPPTHESLSNVILDIKKSISNDAAISSSKLAGSDWLKSQIKSFWEVDNGPLKSLEDDKKINNVLKYRLGINNSIDYEYKLEDGSVVKTNEHFDITLFQVRKGFVVQRKSVSWFKPSAAANIWHRLIGDKNNPIVFDPSAGWGARLLGFSAIYPHGHYYACEPAKKTKKDLDNLSSLLIQELPILKIDIFQQGSEYEVNIDDDSCDAIFTSPPYFDIEKYFDEPGQCWKDYPTFDLWKEKYLKETFKNCYRILKKDCKVAFNVNKQLENTIIEVAIECGFKHEETINLTLATDHFMKSNKLNKSHEPILIFKK